MFQKSVSILIAAVLVALAAVVIFWMFNFSGASQTLARVEALIADQQYARAINLLDQAEHGLSVQQDPALEERVWRLRYGAYSQLGNAAGALEDVENLLRLGHPDVDLQLDHIRLRAQVGDGERARQLALTFLESHPGNSRGLELAGEACQTIYLPLLRGMRAAIQTDVGHAQLDDAIASLLAYVYRPDGDAEVAQGIEHLAAIYGAEARLAAAWGPLQRQLRELRASVQEGIGYFKASLEVGGQPVAAFRGFALSLEQARRIDDLLTQCEIYRRLFDHQFLAEAGSLATRALLRAGLDAAALATAERWQPPGRIQELIDSERVTPALHDLLLARTLAAWHLDDKNALNRMRGDLTALQRANQTALLAMHLDSAALQLLGKDYASAERNLAVLLSRILRADPPVGQPDLAAELVPKQLEVMQLRGAAEAEVFTVLTTWQRARPLDITPLRMLAEFQLQRGNTAAAMGALDDAARLEPNDERLFAVRIATARQHFLESNQDGISLLQQCLHRNTTQPEVANPIGFLLCAETATGKKVYDVALQCARIAVDSFPQVRYPRLLEIRANLAAGRFNEACRLARRLLDTLPPDEATSQLALQAYRAAGLPAAELLFTAMRTCGPSPDLQAELLRSALASEPERAHRFATLPRDKAPTELRILAAQALARAGRLADCRAQLDQLASVAPTLPIARQTELAAAFTAWVETAAASTPDAELAELAGRRIGQLAIRTAAAAPLLLASAQKLAATHAGTAHALCTEALAMADPETRSGETWALAGRLALALGHLRVAEDHWTAALPFPDGRFVAEDLARLCFAQGQSDRALQVYNLVDGPTDAALAARCGKVEVAAGLLTAELARDQADLVCHCTLATVGQPSLTDWQVADEPATQERLELLSLLHSPSLGGKARPRAQALVDADPKSKTNQLLLARALAAAGETRRAAAMHAALFAAGAASPLFWREVAVAAQFPGYEPSPEVALGLMRASAAGGIADSRLTLAYSMQLMAKGFAGGGHPELAERVRLEAWLRAPGTMPLSADDIRLVTSRCAPADAWTVLDGALADRTRTDRRELLTELMGIADRLVEARAPTAATAYAAALRYAELEGPYGCVVHFLLARGARFPEQRPDERRRRQLLLGDLELVATGRDPGPWLERTLDALLEQGLAPTVVDLETVLRRHPTALPLWHERARLMAHLQSADEGIADLRTVLAHARDPEQQLAMLTLAAAERQVRNADVTELDGLPEDLQKGPAGILARGLLELRLGRPDAAVPLLEKAARPDDGLQQYALALALLQSRAKDGAARAGQLFATLARDFAGSPRARNAATFARQLAPR
ncbi:MAG TPA: hypothetical protein VFZ65_12255 [Planctomycetota bacterium]|nr:hypothetical protein [Planctomycetota bacterium]